MKVFLGLMLAAFAMGMLLRGRSERFETALLLGGCALACGAYYFMDQI